MTQGFAPSSDSLFVAIETLVGRLPPTSPFSFLAERGAEFFHDELFTDLFSGRGRRSESPRVVATVMVLQRLYGLSDREAVEKLEFDIRWKYACGIAAHEGAFAHTVLCEWRARLAKSKRPNRLFEVTVTMAKASGLIGRRRVVDSTAIYDAVATQDTVTLVRNALCAVLRSVSAEDAASLRARLTRQDSYEQPGKPSCDDWDDKAAKERLIHELTTDGYAVLTAMAGRAWEPSAQQAMELLATLLGQDLEKGEDGHFRLIQGTARDRIISTVDPEARHGHKTSTGSFDGYKGHIAVDPDSELITSTTVTAGNAHDAVAVDTLLSDILPPAPAAEPPTGAASEPAMPPSAVDAAAVAPTSPVDAGAERTTPTSETEAAKSVVLTSDEPTATDASRPNTSESEVPGSATSDSTRTAAMASSDASTALTPEVFGDAAYGTLPILERLAAAGIDAYVNVPGPSHRAGCYSKDAFTIDCDSNRVTCPAGKAATIRYDPDGRGTADFGKACVGCPLLERCTTSKTGRKLTVHPKERELRQARLRSAQPERRAKYTRTRPKVERKIAHLMKRRHGGRRARVRGRLKVEADFSLLAAAVNFARLARLAAR